MISHTTSNENKPSSSDELLSSPAWARAISACSVPAEAWRRLLSRHLKLAAFVAGDRWGAGFGNSPQQKENVVEQGCEMEISPIHAAASQGVLRAGAVVLSLAPADAGARDGQGRSALHWAAMTDHTEFMKMLLERGASVDAIDCAGRTPLVSCCAFGATAAARLLLQWGADPNAQDNAGLTPLHACAGGGHTETAEVLLSAGADHLRRASIGASPRNVAERQGHIAMVSLLAARGNNVGAGSASSLCAEDSWPRFDRHVLLATPPRRAR